MAVTLQQFLSQLQESGLLSADSIAAFQATHAASVESAGDFADQLVEHEKLTRFQARLIEQGQGDLLLLGDYVVFDTIGAGGMGQVYLAEHRRMGRRVALKTLPEEVAKDQQVVQRFEREVRAAAKLSHPNVVTAYDAGEDKGIHYFVMECVEGFDLSRLVKRHGSLSVERSVNYVLQAARGLKYAHEQGVIHRDIKPSNMLLDNQGTVKILDMGLARIDALDEDAAETGLTSTGMVMGTVDYMAPEQAADSKHADARSDIYSLGCMLHFLLTAESVYTADTMVKKIFAHRDEPVPSLSATHAEVPSTLDAIFQKMLAKNPNDRQQSMSEVISELEACGVLQSSHVSDAPTAVSNDPALDKFQQDQAMVETPTITLQAPDQAPAAEHETLPSGVLDQTITMGGKSTPLKRPEKASPGNLWLMVAGCLLGIVGLVWAAGAFLSAETAVGTIIVEIEQPELAGAVVSIDGKSKVTIKTGKREEPIKVVADEKMHTLKVMKGGFEPFVKEFKVKAGEEQSIRVRLEPEKEIQAKDGRKPAETVKGNWALEFDGKDDYVFMEGLFLNDSKDWTIECRFRGYELSDSDFEKGTVFVGHGSHFFALDINRPLSTFDPFHIENQTRRKFQQKVPWVPQTPYDVSVVISDGEFRMYVNGKLETSSNGQTSFVKGAPPQYNFMLGTGRVWGESNRLINLYSGIIDEVRISNITRYSKDFTPAKRLNADENTLALYHFDEGKGRVLKDSSGNGHHGKIVGANWVRVDDELKVTVGTKPPLAKAPFTAEQAKAHQEAWAKHLGTEVETTNSIGMKFRVIPPGEFLMGSSEEEIAELLEEAKVQKLGNIHVERIPLEGPQHRVTLTRPFGLGAHEVTRGQFRQFVDATGYKTDAEKDGKGGFGYKDGQRVQSAEFLWNTKLGFESEQADDHPVVNVSWDDAVAFCEWLSIKEGAIYRLPTEAEWEFACRAGRQARIGFGNDESKLGDYAWFEENGGRNTMPVAQKAVNALGLFDLHGNVWEWCKDQYGAYSAGPAVDPVGSDDGSRRSLRGGSFLYRSSNVRYAQRNFYQPAGRFDDIGFRLLRTYDASP